MRRNIRLYALFTCLAIYSTPLTFAQQQAGDFNNFNPRFEVFELPGGTLGKRAAAIVTGMLQHALADEYLRLSYHGLRAKDSIFNANMVTDFDPAVGMVAVIPQDIGRVFLNLINNAFYAVHQRKANVGEGANVGGVG